MCQLTKTSFVIDLRNQVSMRKSSDWLVRVMLVQLIWTSCLTLKSLLLVDARGQYGRIHKGMSLWIDESQVKLFSGYPMEIYAIADGHVMPYILDPNFERYLPVIPSDVSTVNFTWKSGSKKQYYYNFDELSSYDYRLMNNPIVSIEPKGKIPSGPESFSVFLPCTGNMSGIGTFAIGLIIQNEKGRFLPGTPFRLTLKKQCYDYDPDPQCDKQCANGGRCNHHRVCECKEGYMGKYCDIALCYPQCMNGGSCISPGVCSCSDGYQGPHCEGGICSEKCLNGGKCIQKDTCGCPRGYHGVRCEQSKCEWECANGGRCVGVNRCRCAKGFHGEQCLQGKSPVGRNGRRAKPKKQRIWI